MLKSIRLRKEELKALEGRRLALEALKKIANDSELQLEQGLQDANSESSTKMKNSQSLFTFNTDRKVEMVNSKMESFVEDIDENKNSEDKLKQVSDLCKFLDMLKERQVRVISIITLFYCI